MANPHLAHVDTRLHRPVVLGRDTCNGSCETPCGCVCVDSSLPAPLPPIKTVEEEFPFLWMAYGLAIVLTVGICALLVELYQ